MASISDKEEDTNNHFSSSNVMVTRPNSGNVRQAEKPPVAAKPKIAPPPPPKPTSLSNSNHPSPTLPSANSHDTDNTQPHSSQNGTMDRAMLKELKLKLSSETSSTNSESEKSLECLSTAPPPLPASPPPVVGRHILSPSSSLSLPATFRSKNLNSQNKNSAHSQLHVNATSSPSPSPVDISSNHAHLPMSSNATNSTVLNIITDHSENTENNLPEAPATETNPHTNTTNSSPTSPSQVQHPRPQVPKRPSYPPQQSSSPVSFPSKSNSPQLSPSAPTVKLKHTGPPTRPAPPLKKSPNPPPSASQPLPAASQPLPDKTLSSIKQPLNNAEKKPDTEQKTGQPPPLPKNPPRGSVPRKRRSSTCKTTPTSEKKPQFPVSQTVVDSSDKARHSSVVEDTSGCQNLNVNDSNANTIITSSESQASIKVPPKPLPRTRVSLPLSNDEQVLDQKVNNIVDTKNHTEDLKNSNQDLHIPAESVSSNSDSVSPYSEIVSPASETLELDYVEVYHGDAEDDEVKADRLIIKVADEESASSKRLKYSKIIIGKSAIEEKHPRVISDQELSQTDSACTELNVETEIKDFNENLDTNSSRLSRLSEQSISLEPEATCDMLKEIEELLKSKLGDANFDIEKKSVDIEKSGNSRGSQSSSPQRPPRPKRQASICRHRGSLESLTQSIDSTSTECINTSGLSSGGKKIPPKPKRMFVSKVNRSNSDVTGMKSLVDSVENSADMDHYQQTQDGKPYLPPRLDSLKRSESCSSSVTPPPLPPRNKPSSADTAGKVYNQGKVGTGDSNTPVSSRKNPFNTDTGDSTYKPSLATPPDTGSSTLKRSSKPRPTRVAPPPPPGPPKRAATFSTGDTKQNSGEERENISDGSSDTSDPAALLKGSLYQYKAAVDDHDYHEITEHSRVKKEMTPPPELPPRLFRSNSLKSKERSSSKDSLTQLTSTSLRGSTESLKSQSPETARIVPVKRLSPEDQRLREKRAKTALIQKVAQGLGFGKGAKKSKSFESPEPNTSHTVNTNTPVKTVIESEPANTETPHVEDIQPAEIQATDLPADVAPTGSTSSSDQRSSTISQQSSNSEQEVHVFDHQVIEEIPSSESESEPEPDKEEIYAQRKAKKVFFIAKEIMSSESTFVDVLRLLNLDFRVHVSMATERLGQPVIPTETLNKILDYLPQLLNFNEDLLKDLTERIEKWEINPRISDVFVKKGPFLKLYSTYISNFENATSLLENSAKKYPAFATALKEFEMSPRCAHLALKHFMLKPIQRIPQYKLLLQDYLKNLSPLSLDYKDTITALNIVSAVADHANESMRHGDNVQKLLEIQRSLIGQFEVIQPGRILIKQGELQKLSRKEMQPRMFFLFNDVLLYTTGTATGYKINNILPLAGMKVNAPKLEDYRYEFNIIGFQRSFTLSASTPKEKEDWVSALQGAIDKNAKRHQTFDPLKQSKDFVLGAKAPLWVPDARVTMCMVCLVEFTLTWRRHHCRSCGRIICSHCSDNKAPLQYLNNKPARVCDHCYTQLHAEILKRIEAAELQKSVSPPVSPPAREDSAASPTSASCEDVVDGEMKCEVNVDSSLNLQNLLARFQKLRLSNRKNNQSRPSVLKEVKANDEGSDMSGYLRAYKSRKWKRLWFVVKGKVLYTYKASEDVAATESMPLLGYEVTCLTTPFEGAEPHYLFELTHKNNQPLLKKNLSEKTTQRLIFRTDTAEATTKWVTVLKEASLTDFN
ncbi:FYVE, RhoGEF and PH domain-containing protein 6-like isoform X2 [Physella acuta]|uniref:FYVE, RhoGEF and PH domain-containing protein 6-like isoform X2 n=1 Tax=Physella acuta TaxID=109671 RepID=UPI0027DC1CA4|nr:FYVE, RhoGEF and PH domain-containing protein 6-like isoform X2 [Physella acuta]